MRTIIFFAVLLVGGCAIQKLAPDADFGKPPQGYSREVKVYLDSRLKDPESAKYQFGRPQRAHVNEVPILGGRLKWHGWIVPVEVNAKNSFGGYTGFKSYYVEFIGPVIVGLFDAEQGETLTFVGSPLSIEEAKLLDNLPSATEILKGN